MQDSVEFYAYIYYDPSRNNEPIYAGKGSGERAWKHLKQRKMHPFIQRLQLMKKDDVVPIIEIIPAMDESHAFFMEECIIEVHGRKDLGKGSLLNLTNGGEGSAGNKPSALTKQKMSLAKLGKCSAKFGKKYGPQHTAESKLKISQGNKSKVLSEESKEKIRVANTGKTLADETKKKISESHLARYKREEN